MSEPKHTKGPWTSSLMDYHSEDPTVIAISGSDNNVCEILDGSVEDADLALILVAPDMYEALEHLRIVAQKVCDDFCCGAGCCSDATDCHLEDGLIHAEIALRKARGETE